MVIQKILTQPLIALTFLLILVFLWLAAWRRDRRDSQLKRRAKSVSDKLANGQTTHRT
jgi:uncharacterized membrane protein